MSGEFMLPGDTSEVLRTREPYFEQADLLRLPIFCGDERPADGAYIHVFGGVGNTAYNLLVLREDAAPGSVEQPLDEAVVSLIPELQKRGINAGVHSDDHTEHSTERIRTDKEIGPIGCGYLEKRQAISQLTYERGREIVDILKQKDPVLYGSQQNRERAFKFCQAHGRLKGRSIYPLGRKIAISALQAGAPFNIVTGEHIGEEGVINKHSGTLDSARAFRDGLPTYNHDSWAAVETYDALKDLYDFDRTDYEIANDVDAVGTMLALGVKRIAVRR